jgi:AcrR family transcriptional regulator
MPRSNAAKRDPKANKQVLVDATLITIAEHGITDTSVSRIIERAGLSRGMIHLHFGSKDNLLSAAAKQFSEEYYATMDRETDLGPDTPPEDRILAIVRADLSEALLNPQSSKIWHAFRGVASTHVGIAKYSSTQDAKLVSKLRTAFRQLASEDGLQPDIAEDATSGTLALLEGMWVNYLTDQKEFSREDAASLIRRFLAGLFPNRFAEDPNQ